MTFLGIFITIGSIFGAIALLSKGKEAKSIHVYSDYKMLLNAVIAYKEANKEYAKAIGKLEPYIENFNSYDFSKYDLSMDGKFLTVFNLMPEEAEELINEIGGDSYINGKFTYLTLRRIHDLSEVKPIAHFSMKPEDNLTTTTHITYDLNGCVTENGEIIEKKWENKMSVFHDPGIYLIRLKVKDTNGNWSDYFEKEVKVTEESGIRAIKAYDGSFFMTYNNGKTLSYGKNDFGQLGIGTLNPIPKLTYSNLYDGVTEIACGESFNIFRFYDGSVFTAGNNHHGELASGDKNALKLLTQIWGLENIKQVEAGRRFGAALDLNGDVFVWGDNTEGQLMNDDYIDSPYPVKLPGVSGIKQIACGSNFGLALRYDGTVIGWGDNSYGQLGLGFKGSINEPTMTLYKNVKRIAAGDRFSCVVTENGKVVGAGNNAFGQLGSKGMNEFLFPEEILKIRDVETLNICDSLVLAILKTGKAFVWGNFNGPGSKPIYEPFELSGIQYVKASTNNGKKCFIVDGNYDLYVISDITGKNEKNKVHENFYDFMDAVHSKTK
ncbi:MAG: hypothetical protein IBX70_06440 [Clostridia bacterium]|nr:hypothetical protein [Clostridia bacterium]